MDKIKLMSITVMLIVFLAVALSGCAGIGDSEFTIRVSGSDGMIFSGAYALTTSAGGSISQSVEGTAPAQYRVKGNIVSATFQKQNPNGVLTVEILKNGQVVSQSTTSAAYGVVSVATQ